MTKLICCLILGAVYCDGVLKMGGFTGEGFHSGVVLAVKDHNPRFVWKNELHQGGVSTSEYML